MSKLLQTLTAWDRPEHYRVSVLLFLRTWHQMESILYVGEYTHKIMACCITRLCIYKNVYTFLKEDTVPIATTVCICTYFLLRQYECAENE